MKTQLKMQKIKLLSKLESNRQRDIETRMTKYGIHKDDLNIFIKWFRCKIIWFSRSTEDGIYFVKIIWDRTYKTRGER